MSTRNSAQPEGASEHGLLFVDVSDSTRWLVNLGDAEGQKMLRAALGVLEEAAQKAGGQVMDQVGDELFCLFTDGHKTVSAAVAMQRALLAASLDRRLPAQLRARVGVHVGLIPLEDGRPYGSQVTLARRVASLSKSEQILASRGAVDSAGSLGRLARKLESLYLKGLDEPIEVFDILWNEGGGATALASEMFEALEASSPGEQLHLRHGERELALQGLGRSYTVGRREDCDLVVDHPAVSRLHARVEARGRTFVWVDMSTNGSRIYPQEGPPEIVRRAELSLVGRGTIELGIASRSHAAAPARLQYAVRLPQGR